MFMGVGTLSSLIKLQEVRVSSLSGQVRPTSIYLIRFLQIVIDCLALFGVAYARTAIPYDSYNRIFQVAFLYFAVAQSVMEYVIAAPVIKLIYYCLMCRPVLNFLLFVYLGDFMQKFVNKSTVSEILLQGVVLSGFANIQKFINNEVITRYGFSVILFVASIALLNIIIDVLNEVNKDDPVINQFKPQPTDFNTAALVNFSKLRNTLSQPIAVWLYATVILFTFLNVYYDMLQVKETKLLQNLDHTIVIRVLPKTIALQRGTSESINGIFTSLPLASWKKRNVTNVPLLRALGVYNADKKQINDQISRFKFDVVVHKGKKREFVSLNVVRRELILTQLLQVLLFLFLALTNLFPQYTEQISATAFLTVPFAALINSIYNGSSLIEQYHLLQSIDMALKKTTKDYSYSKMDYEYKCYLRMVCQIYVEPISKILGLSVGSVVRTYGVTQSASNPLAVFVSPVTYILSVILCVLWTYAAFKVAQEVISTKSKTTFN